MKTLTKISAVAAIALALTTFGTPKAEAAPWFLPPVPRVLPGLAVGTAVGLSVAAAHAPIYVAPGYGYPAYGYGYPAYGYPVAAPVYYGSRAVWGGPYAYGYGYGRGWGYGRGGFGWGRGGRGGYGHGYRR